MNILTLSGFTVLALGIWAANFVRRSFKSGNLDRLWIFAEAVVLIIGVVLGIAALAYSSYPDPDTRLLGFPFIAAAFERSSAGAWADFIGIRTLPATVGNFAVGLLFPQLLFAVALWLRGKVRPPIKIRESKVK